jgi:hypothetical protein
MKVRIHVADQKLGEHSNSQPKCDKRDIDENPWNGGRAESLPR